MNKEFIQYEEALALKELGFNNECFGYYSDWGTQEPFLISCELGHEFKSCKTRRKNFLCKAPLFQQAFRFFREKYGLDYIVEKEKIKTKYYSYSIEDSSDLPISLGLDLKDDATYEDAELACLKKLIEIVKQK